MGVLRVRLTLHTMLNRGQVPGPRVSGPPCRPLANGQEFRKFVDKLDNKPDVIFTQETWLKPHFDFKINGYTSVRKDRETGNGGGVVSFIKQGLNFNKKENKIR